MLFSSLFALRDQCKALATNITFRADGTMQVLVTPVIDDKAKEDNAHLAQPFQLTGTAQELDEGFAAQFDKFTAARKTLAEQADAQVKRLAAEAETARNKAAQKTGKAAATGGEAAGAALSKALEGGAPTAAAAPAAAGAAAVLEKADDLFGGEEQ